MIRPNAEPLDPNGRESPRPVHENERDFAIAADLIEEPDSINVSCSHFLPRYQGTPFHDWGAASENKITSGSG